MRTASRPTSCCEPRSASGRSSERTHTRGTPAGRRGARRAARAARERGERPSTTPAPRTGTTRVHDSAEPVRAAALDPPRTAVAERPPLSRAARAQRIGRPGRPALPPAAPKPRAAGSAASSRCSRSSPSARRSTSINATFQPFQGEDEQAGAVAGQIPEGADASAIGELLEAQGRRSTTRASSSSTPRSRCAAARCAPATTSCAAT